MKALLSVIIAIVREERVALARGLALSIAVLAMALPCWLFQAGL